MGSPIKGKSQCPMRTSNLEEGSMTEQQFGRGRAGLGICNDRVKDLPAYMVEKEEER